MKEYLFALVALLMAASCLAPDEPSAAADEDFQALEFEVRGMTCDTCAKTASGLLADIPGVRQARVNFDSRTGSVAADDTVTVADIRSALSASGFEARFPGDPPGDSARLPDEERAGLDIRTISHGEAVTIKEQLAPGKVTIFDYYADWCGPCHLFTPKLERLVKRYTNVALRKVDIVDWSSDAAKQASSDYRMSGLPYVRVYGPDGEVLGSVVGNHVEQVEALLRGHVQQ